MLQLAWVLCDLDPGDVHGHACGELHLRGVRALLGPGRHRLQAAPALAPARQVGVTPWEVAYLYHGEIIYGDTSWIEDDCPDTFSEFIFLFPLADALCHDF